MQLERRVRIGVRDGLHARPAAQLVRLAKGFSADVAIERGNQVANAKSSVKLMLLGVKEADEVLVKTSGADAVEALDRIVSFLAGETSSSAPDQIPSPVVARPGAPPPEARSDARLVRGVPVSDGVAIGPAHLFIHPPLPEPVGRIDVAAAGQEIERYRAALAKTVEALQSPKSSGGDGGAMGEIVAALCEVANDPEWSQQVEERIRNGADSAAAVILEGRELARRFDALDDPYARARSEDIRSVVKAVVFTLLGRAPASLAAIAPGAIVLADELTALDLTGAAVDRIGGLVCGGGGATSHAAIVARARGIPAIFGCEAPIERFVTVRTVALDGGAGEASLDPDAETRAEFERRLQALRREAEVLSRYRVVEPRTRDGKPIVVAVNLGALSEIEPAQAAGAVGVGLFRTEFLFMERPTLPTEDEQVAVYSQLLERFRPQPVVIRTLDVGGDKPLRAIAFPKEENPFLGWRGVRVCLDRNDIFAPQLRALLRAAPHGRLQVMIPMVSDIEELRAVKARIATCRAELGSAGIAHGWFELGMMVETPAAVFSAKAFAREVEFFSIGTNDLTQYVMAADRTNPRVAALNRADHPAVVEAIRMVCEAAAAAGIPVAVCGEAAGRPEMTATLIRLGVSELSMSASSILRVKRAVTESWATPRAEA